MTVMRQHAPVVPLDPADPVTCSCGTWRIDEESCVEHMHTTAMIKKLDAHNSKREDRS